jgi:hypothetical protein
MAPTHIIADTQHNNMMAMMATLQRRLTQPLGGDRERRFLTHSLEYLYTASGRQVKLESWMITSFDIEFGPKIGAGGLLVTVSFLVYATSLTPTCSGHVYEATWNKTPVALKVIKTESGLAPSPDVCV